MSNELEAIWDAVCKQLRELGSEVLREAPLSDLARAEGLRYICRLFRYAVLMQLEARTPGRPVIGFEGVRIGGDNPDFRYGSAAIDGNLNYVLRGKMNDAARLGIGTFSGGLGTEKGSVCDGYISSDELTLDSEGCFEILLSSDSSNLKSGTLAMRPETRSLLIRETLLRRSVDRPAEFKLECLTPGQEIVAMDAEALYGGLGRLNSFIGGTVRQFLGWTNTFKARPNEILPIEPSLSVKAQGDAKTRYYNGYFSLPSPDVGLEVFLTPPPCQYWNIQICNHWLESIDPISGPTNLNNASVATEADGSVRIVISSKNPGDCNWIDTVGHREGGIAMRIIGMDPGQVLPNPRCRVVQIDPVR